MIQGGGMTADMKQKPTRAPIQNEPSNGLKNRRGTLSMARTNDPAQRHVAVLHEPGRQRVPRSRCRSGAGYAVFGHVTEGMSVIDAIAKVKTGRQGRHDDVPVEPIVVISAKRVDAQGRLSQATQRPPR